MRSKIFKRNQEIHKKPKGGGPHRQNDVRRFDLLNPQQFDCALHCNRGPDFDALTNFPILSQTKAISFLFHSSEWLAIFMT